MCDFCNSEEKRIKIPYSGDDNCILREPTEMFLKDNRLVLITSTFRGTIYTDIGIKYCPMCGRKLE